MQLKFEDSFPSTVYGDENLLQQIIYNTLQLIIEKNKREKIELDCFMKSALPDGEFLLDFVFSFPATANLPFDLLKKKLEIEKSALLDDFLNNDELK